MRLFAALPLPAPAQAVVAGCLTDLEAQGWPVRWVRREGLHLTLKFFGEVTSDRLDPIVEMLGFAVRDMGPMTLAMSGAGVFPYPSRPRILRLDLEGPIALELLQDRIERGGEGIGFPPEGRPFRPHITLGRVREGHRLPEGALARLSAAAPHEAFVADRIVLFESELGTGGPRYRVRAEFPLRAADAE